MRFLFLFAIASILSIHVLQAQGPFCAAASPFCTNSGSSFPGGVNNGSAEPGNSYGCLGSQPNPAWFFLEIGTAGNINIGLTNSSNVDVDFALWGPFPDLGAALGSCGGLGAPVSCSFSPSANETVVVPTSTVGQVYLLLITNFSNQPTNITANQTGGTGATNCGILCIPDGGTIAQPPVAGCQGSASLALSWPDPVPQPPGYLYTWLITQGGTIQSYGPGPILTGLAPGSYQVCGLSYNVLDGAAIPAIVGQPFGQLQNNLLSPTPPFCGETSTNCINVTISPPLPPITLTPPPLCPGDCFTAPDNMQYCAPGPYSIQVPTPSGCDQQYIFNLTLQPPSAGQTILNVCPGACATFNNMQYCPPGPYNVTLTNAVGCDSLLTIFVVEMPLLAVINPPGPITCTTPAVLLDGSPSVPAGGTYQWSGPNGFVASGPQVPVTVQGIYTLTYTAPLTGNPGTLCTSTATVNVTSTVILPTPPIIIGNPTPCGNSPQIYAVTPDPSVSSYTWVVPPGVQVISGGTSTSASVTVNWGTFTGGNICVTAVNACGTTPQECFPVIVTPAPQTPQVVGDLSVCIGQTNTYVTVPDPFTTTYAWTVPAGAVIVSGQGTPSITVNWPITSTSGTVCVTGANPCGTTSPVCLPVAVLTPPMMPTVVGNPTYCVSEPGAFNLLSGDPTVTSTSWSITPPTCGSITTGQGTNSIIVTWTPGCGTTSLQVCATITNACGPTIACFPVTITPTPTVNAGPNGQTCGLTYSLVAPGATTGTWALVSGAGTANFANASAAATSVTVSTFGSYTFSFTTGTGACQGSDQVVVQFNDAPTVPGVVSEICDATSTNYTVSFTISGGNSPYTVNSNPITGAVFTSAPINSGTPYSFSILDANGCGPIVIDGTRVCNCLTNAGTMSLSLLSACQGQALQGVWNNNATLDGDDLGFYYLHTNSGSSLGTVIATNSTGLFSFQAPMVLGTTYYISYVVGSNNGSGAIDLTDPCLSVAQGQPIRFIGIPQPNAGMDNSVCGNTYNLTGSLQLSSSTAAWTQLSGPGTSTFSTPASANTQVTVTTNGIYIFQLQEAQGTCQGTDPVTITFQAEPFLTNVVSVCDPATLQYTVSFTLNGGAAPYNVSGSVNGTITGNVFTSVPIPSGASYNFSVVNAANCGPAVLTGSFDCNCSTDAGTMSLTAVNACQDASITVTSAAGSVLDGDDVLLYYLHTLSGNTLGTVLATSPNPTFALLPSMMTGVTYYVSAVAGTGNGTGGINQSDPCLDIAAGTPIQFIDLPQPNAGVDDAICALTYDLTGVLQLSGTSATWSQISGPGTATFIDSTTANTSVTVTDYGIYAFELLEAQGTCQGTDQVTITFQEVPFLTNVTRVCDPATLAYTVSFTLNGGLAPYTVTGSVMGTITGNVFTSAPIPGGTNYNFSVTNAANCGPTILNGSFNCNCTTDAGTMNTTLVRACRTDPITVPSTLGSVLDNDDVLLYYLHTLSGNTLGTVLATSPTPTFSILPGMMTGVTYYISAVAGTGNGTGGINLNDPCLDIAEGTPIVFRALPTVMMSGNATFCESGQGVLNFTFQNGVAPYTVIVTSPSGATISIPNLPQNGTYSIPVSSTSTYTLASVTDANGCTNTAMGTVTFTINTPPIATVTAGAQICNAADNGNPTIINFNTLITSGSLTGTWLDVNNSGATGAFPNKNFLGVTPGNYTFTYTLNTAVAPCTNPTYTVTVVVENCVCPSVATIAGGPLCNNSGSLNLQTMTVTTAPGTWTLSSTPAGVQPGTLTGTLFDVSNADAGVYGFTFTLNTPPPPGCPTESMQSITVANAANAGIAAIPLELCEGLDQVVTLRDQLSGEDTGGQWRLGVNSSVTNGGFNANGGTFDVFGESPGSYLFQYVLTPTTPCPVATSEIQIIIHPNPIADAGVDKEGTCTDPDVVIGGDLTTVEPDVSLVWTFNNGAYTGTQGITKPTVMLPGIYTLTTTNNLTGCSDTDQVEVVVNDEIPVPELFISDVSCFGNDDGAISITNITGGTPPYQISFNDGPFGDKLFFQPLGPGEYDITITDSKGCSNSLKIEIVEPSLVDVNIGVLISGENNVVFYGDSITLEAQTSIPPDQLDTIIWSPRELLNCGDCLEVIGTPLSTTTFSVEISKDGCAAKDEVTIFVRKEFNVYVPTAFSPNGDENNNTFKIYTDDKAVKILKFMVVDRWGETVYSYKDFDPNDPAGEWNGTFRNEPLDPAVFAWWAEIEFVDGSKELFKGDVTLVR